MASRNLYDARRRNKITRTAILLMFTDIVRIERLKTLDVEYIVFPFRLLKFVNSWGMSVKRGTWRSAVLMFFWMHAVIKSSICGVVD